MALLASAAIALPTPINTPITDSGVSGVTSEVNQVLTITTAEGKNLLVELEERRARMKRDAAFRIEQELKEARAQLLAEAVRGAVAAAEQIIRTQVSSADQQRLADDYLSALPVALGPADGQAKEREGKAQGATL